MYMYAYLLLLKEISFGMTIFVNSVYKYVCKYLESLQNWTVVDTLYLNSLNPNLQVINRQVPIMWLVQIGFFCAMNLFYQFKCKKCIYIYMFILNSGKMTPDCMNDQTRCQALCQIFV